MQPLKPPAIVLLQLVAPQILLTHPPTIEECAPHALLSSPAPTKPPAQ